MLKEHTALLNFFFLIAWWINKYARFNANGVKNFPVASRREKWLYCRRSGGP